MFLGYELCQSMRRVLTDDQPDPSWSQRAQRVMATLRAEHDFLADAASPMIERGEEITWWTFAGGRATLLLAKIIEAALGEKVIARNTSLTCRGNAAKSIAALRHVLDTLRAEGRPKAEDATAHAAGALRGRISKFQEAVPPALLSELIATLLLDVEGAARTVSERR